jgi:hypothetical protein
MVLVKNTFQERVDEINLYYGFINSFIPTNRDENLNRILKSNMILMLYNLVESTISNSIEEIHNSIHASAISFDTLKVELKEVIIKHLKDKNPKKFVESVTHLAIDVVKKSFDKRKVCNGNVDSLKIRELSGVYGFSSNTTYAQTKNGQILLDIKGKRNDLAHGTFSFVEIGKVLTPEDLEKMKDETVSYLKEIVANIEYYLTNQEYKQVAV